MDTMHSDDDVAAAAGEPEHAGGGEERRAKRAKSSVPDKVKIAVRGPVFLESDGTYKTGSIEIVKHITISPDMCYLDARDQVLIALGLAGLLVDAIKGKMYCASQSNSLIMHEIKGTESMHERWKTYKKGTVPHFGIGGAHDDYDDNEARPTIRDDEGCLTGLQEPPQAGVKKKDNARSMAKADTGIRNRILAWQEACYTDPRSLYLANLSVTNSDLFEELLTDVAQGIFPAAEDFDKYCAEKTWSTIHHTAQLQGCTFGKGKYPPFGGEIPNADRGHKMDLKRAAGGAPGETPAGGAFDRVAEAMNKKSDMKLELQARQHAHDLVLATMASGAKTTSVAVAAGSTASAQNLAKKLARASRKLTEAQDELTSLPANAPDESLRAAQAKFAKYQKQRDALQAEADPSDNEG
ncbi:hypothetical protein B484DRAFT_404404 [Ochromonadaceae sp. CCMP2298]|nr:hypothetical protein B484DRAFT_404404 [Ochromonadaceae sp. CCMP2298]